MTDPVLTIVVGTFNRLDQLRRLIDSIAAQTTIPHEIFITDAGSTDGTVEYLCAVRSTNLHPLFLPTRIGQARAYNDIFKDVGTPYVCWLSDDNQIINHSLDTAVNILNTRQEIGMVGLKVRDMRGPFVETSYIGAISSIGVLNVNQGVLRTDVIHEVGGFSKDFRDYGIDPDLTARVLLKGHDIVYTRDIAILHYRNWSADETSAEYKAHEKRRLQGLDLYNKTYADMKEMSPAPHIMAKLWSGLRKIKPKWLDLSLNSKKEIFGSIPRDYYNAFHARHIHPLDPIFSLGKPYHLRQKLRGAQVKTTPLPRQQNNEDVNA